MVKRGEGVTRDYEDGECDQCGRDVYGGGEDSDNGGASTVMNALRLTPS